MLLGQDVIRQWASMLLLTRLGDNKPSELLVLALTRGHMCQALGAYLKAAHFANMTVRG